MVERDLAKIEVTSSSLVLRSIIGENSMASGTRFYLLAYKNDGNRPILFEDMGNILKISGAVFEGAGTRVIALLPSAADGQEFDKIVRLTPEEWSEVIRLSDDPQVLINGTHDKALHRKLRFEISGLTQQRVWVRDGLKCMYCGRRMGEVQLTIDHWQPLEHGGANDERNFLAACRGCNKNKGSILPEEWCRQRGLDYQWFVEYVSKL